MADTLHELAIKIYGNIDGRFGDAIRELQGHLGKLKESVKNIADSKIKMDGISNGFAKTSNEAVNAVRQLDKLNQLMKDMDGYEKQSKELAVVTTQLDKTVAEVRRLEAANKESGFDKYGKQLRSANKENEEALAAYRKQNNALLEMKGALADAGINVDNLSVEKKRLAEAITNVSKKEDDLAKSMERLAETKHYLNELRGHVKQLGADFLWVGQTWLKMGSVIKDGVSQLLQITGSVADAGDAAAKSAEKLGMSADAFQELQYAAARSGVSDFEGMMSRFGSAVAEASSKQSDAAKTMKELGLNTEQFAGLKPEYAVIAMADELNKITDPAKRARAEMVLFGESGGEIGKFLSVGSDGMKDLIERARELGIVIPSEATKQSDAFLQARADIGHSISGLKNIIGVELLPVFTEAFGTLAQFFIDNQDVVREFAQGLGEKFREMLPELKNFAVEAVNLIGKLWEFGKTIVSLVGGVENFGLIIAALPLIKPLLTIGKLIGTVGNLAGIFGLGGKALGLFSSAVKGLGSAFGVVFKGLGFVASGISGIFTFLMANPIVLVVAAIAAAIAGAVYLIYKNWEPIKEKFFEICNSVKAAFGTASAWVGEKIAAISAFFSEMYESAKEKLFALKDGIFAAFGTVADWVGEKVAGVSAFITGLWEGIVSAAMGAKDALFGAVSEVFGFYKDTYSKIPEMLREIFSGVKEILIKPFRDAFGWVDEKWGNLKKTLGFGSKDDAGSPEGSRIIDPRLQIDPIPSAPSAYVFVGQSAWTMPQAADLKKLEDVSAPLKQIASQSPSARKPPVMMQANWTPHINLTVNGGTDDLERIRDVILRTMREAGGSMLSQWAEEGERVAYVTS